ncbi:helix-turn-helix domain-containing protein [Oceanobacillus chungangensis]|uniref:HTH araC/xylS-type domain-containing protein n=1 Tax=Oceanobacillus chungangensis TaxID=1229152 RepID=A0A3D8PPY0_9BACI|nr:helix-turn-helix domain-containing protein [Oceanobacillus chungangensis]RDW18024.1 hypothetical protein CWR45_11910 [Oceanobacillus chungangensis]
MKQSRLITTALKIQQITNLNIYVLDQYSDFIYYHELLTIPEYVPGYDQADILDLHHNMKRNGKAYSYINEWGLHYLGFRFLKKRDEYTVIIGPYLDTTPNVYSLSREYNLSSMKGEELRGIIDEIYVLTTDQASSYASMLRLFDTMLENEMDHTIIVADKTKEAEYNRQTNTNLDEEAEIVELRYSIEKDFMFAVEQGNKTEALKLISSGNLLFSFSERFPNQPIRRVKNILIVMNTMLRIAARNSNVPTILIHRISEKYALQIEHSSKLATLNQLQDNMIAAYCDLVSENALRHYSKIIQIAIEHIQIYYDQQLNLEEIAKACNTHPSHLSRSFKKETNMTITAYQQMLRMNRAKYLLETEPLAIEEIAWIVGYEDSSYFARVFKKEIGCTPTVYRKGK